MLAGEGVAELVADLDEHKTQIQKHEVRRVQHVGALSHQLTEVADGEKSSGAHQHQPQQQSRPTVDGTDQAHPAIQQGVGIEQRDAKKEKVGQISQHFPLNPPAIAIEQTRGVGRQIDVQQVHRVELAQEVNRLALGRGGIAEAFVAQTPDLGHRSSPVEGTGKLVGVFVHPGELAVGGVLQHVPEPAAEGLPTNPDFGQQSRPQARHAVPGFMECGAIDGHLSSAICYLLFAIFSYRRCSGCSRSIDAGSK